MIDLTPTASPLPKTWSTLARWALGLVLAAWFAFGLVWGALHWLIVPRIGELRPYVETRATQVLGVRVRIGSISAFSSGLVPSFELTDVKLFDPQGREALHLPRVLAALSPRSVMRLGFEQLYVERPNLSVRRSLDGKIRVAGLDFSASGEPDSGAADWFFSQLEFVIRDGQVQWTDELRAAPTLALAQVDLVVRNQGRRHELRLDATPPALWGDRFSVRGLLTQPLLSLQRSQWQDWSGQLHGAFDRVDVSELRRYADLGIDLHQGSGALRAWVDLSRGQVVGGAADVALSSVRVTLAPNLEALELKSVNGRLSGRALASGFEFATQSLAFDTHEGVHWPGGNVRVMQMGAEGKMAARGEFKADQLDLTALAQIANRLPIDAHSRAMLLAYAPKGLVEQVQASWLGPLGSPSRFDVKGRVSRLELDAVGDSPGIQNASIDFDLSQSAGNARVVVTDGTLSFPTIFDEPVIAVQQLSTDVKWQIEGDRIAVQLPNMKFNNADAQGEAQIKWQTSDPVKSSGRARFPGVLDLQANLSRANGARVHRYLPSIIDRPARDYVRDAVLAGSASNVKFRVKGDLYDMPFADARQGEFRISANVKNARLAFVPRSLQAPDAPPWPPLTQLNGELVIDRTKLQVRNASARMGAASGLQISKVEALIADLSHSTVVVSAEARGALTEGLGIVNGSPVGPMIGQALARAVGTGSADYKLKLSLPLAALDTSTVQGSVTLAGNDIQMSPDTPRLARARGVVNFNENGFLIVGGQAQMLGGEARLEGGSLQPPAGPNGLSASRTAGPIVIRANGTATADGLRQARELGFVARLAQHASGSAPYAAVLGFRQGIPELTVTSTLQGLALSLPAPLNKSAQAALPLRLETALTAGSLAPGQVRLQEQLKLDLGSLASISYVRDVSDTEQRVRRGSIAVGLEPQESAPMPLEGVVANIKLDQLDLDAWGNVLSQAAETPLASAALANSPPAVGAGASPAAGALGYLPTTMAVRARELTVGGRTLQQVVVGGSREGLLWRANLDATELNGYLEYRQSSDAGEGRVFARLSRLTLAPGADRDVEELLNEQPDSIPALDIVVDDFVLRGKRLGRVEVQAVNRRAGGVREWRLNKFNMSTPEAVLTATGNWATPPASVLRRTVMNFKLDIFDSGELLSRLGMKGVVRKGQGKMEGQVAWTGSPITLDYPSMTGSFTVDVENGQFLKADPGIAKLLGVLSLQSLPRRLTLDFRDVFSEGFPFDFFRGDIAIEQGIAITNNLQMKGVNAAVLMEGRADIARETQDIKAVVIPEINAGTASLIASVINPAVGIGTFLAQMFLRKPLTEAATQEFHIDGSWADPKITRVPRRSGGTPAAQP